MFDPNKMNAVISMLQEVLGDISDTDAENSIRNLNNIAQTLQNQLAHSQELEANIARIRTGLEANLGSLRGQENRLRSSLDRIERDRQRSMAGWERKLREASRTGRDVDDLLKIEERRDRSMDRFDQRAARANANLQALLGNIGRVLGQQNRLNTAAGVQAGTTARTNTALNQTRQSIAAQNALARTRNQMALRFSQILGLNPAQVRATMRALSSMTGFFGASASIAVEMFSNVYKEFRKQGQSAVQSVTNSVKAFGYTVQGIMSGVFASPVAYARNLAMLQTEFGRMNISSDLVTEATSLTEQYGLSNEEAGKLIGTLERVHGFQTGITAAQLQAVKTQARAAGMGPGAVGRELVKNTQYFAQYANEGYLAFAKSVMEIKKMGVQMSTLEGFADKTVGDFEGFLTLQAKIATFLPGFDLSAYVFAAQNGDTAQQAQELQAALRNTGMKSISDLPRSTRNMLNEIAPLQEIETLLKGGNPTDLGDPNDVISNTADAFVNSIEKLAVPALTALAAAATLAATGVGRLGLGGLFSRGAGAAAGGVAAGAGRVATFAGRAAPILGRAAGAIGTGLAAYGQYTEDRAAGLSKSTSAKNAGIVGAGGMVGSAAGGMAAGAAVGLFAGPVGVAIGASIGMAIGAVAGTSFAKMFTDKRTDAQKREEQLARIEEAAQRARIDRMNAAYDAHISRITVPTPSKGFFSGGFDIRQGGSTQRGEVKHSGGIVGKGSARLIPRFHSGYMPDEVPAILQRGEAVLSRTQLSGLTNIMNVVQSLGKIGDSFAKIKVDALDKVSGTVGKISGTFNSIKSMFSKSDGKDGGLLSAAKGLIGKKGEGISSKLQGMFGGKSESGGIVGSLKNKAKSFISGKAGGILSKFTGNASTNSAVASLTGGKSLKSTALGMLKNTGIGKKVMGIGGGLVSKFATGKLGSAVLNKIPGAGIIGSLFKKGDKKKNVAKAAGSAVAGKLIGSAIGSVIPGAGTIVGGLVGSVAGKLVGKALGGLFKKKKKPAAPIQPPIVAQSDSDEGYTTVSGTGTNGQPVAPVVNVDLKPVEQQLQQLIMLMQNGGIVVNLDGKKVGGGLTDAFSRG